MGAEILTAMGLASASGLNLHLPLLVLGLVAKFSGFIKLQAPYDLLTHPAVLTGLAILTVVEFIADKVPAVDHVWHSIGLVLHPVAGAILFLATTQGQVHPAIATLAGLVLAGTTHAARAGLRPASTATTGGVGNPALSLVEDGVSGGLTLAAIFLPFLAGVLTVLLFGFLFWGVSRIWKRQRR